MEFIMGIMDTVMDTIMVMDMVTDTITDMVTDIITDMVTDIIMATDTDIIMVTDIITFIDTTTVSTPLFMEKPFTIWNVTKDTSQAPVNMSSLVTHRTGLAGVQIPNHQFVCLRRSNNAHVIVKLHLVRL
jgi:hypothetical protein